MCGRYALTLPQDAMVALFDALPDNDLPATPRYNICPTQDVHAVTSEAGARRLRALRWGLVPFWAEAPGDGPLMINARAETIAQKPAFRDAVRKRRCLIPASGFYEWTKDEEGNRLPWYFSAEAPLAFAGIWQDWTKGEAPLTSCAIVTCASEGPMTGLHHRTPVVIAPEDWPLWLGEAEDGKAAPLMRPPPEGLLRWHRVGREVNSNRARGEGLIEPLEGAG